MGTEQTGRPYCCAGVSAENALSDSNAMDLRLGGGLCEWKKY